VSFATQRSWWFIDMQVSALRVVTKRAGGLCLPLAILVGLLGSAAPRAKACSYAEPLAFQIDPSLRDHDGTPPTPFSDIVPFAHRISATHCHADRTCTESSCGDDGVLELSFVRPIDVESAPEELGYRVIWLSGAMPAGLASVIDDVQPLAPGTSLSIALGFAGVTSLNGELALVAVDRAGNESAPSEPVHVEYTGCTSYFDDPTCIGAPSPTASCAVSPPSRPATGWIMPVLIGLAFARRRGRRPA
jgi:hypothetical protein